MYDDILDLLKAIIYGTNGPILLKHFLIERQFSDYEIKGMEHVPNIFVSFDNYLFLEVMNILI